MYKTCLLVIQALRLLLQRHICQRTGDANVIKCDVAKVDSIKDLLKDKFYH